MAQSDIMQELIRRRALNKGWTTIRQLEKVFKGISTNSIRKQTNALVAYNFVETRRRSKHATEFQIKDQYMEVL